jgi:NADPH:quinone reductase-like Zn-dependent oxidoreductase
METNFMVNLPQALGCKAREDVITDSHNGHLSLDGPLSVAGCVHTSERLIATTAGGEMKAVLLRGYGGVEQLQYEEVPTPNPGPGEVLVRVISTSVNPVDYKIRSGMMKDRMPLTLPTVLGRDVAGVVAALGTNVTRWKVGDNVMGLVNHSYAEYLTAKADVLTGIPEGLDPKDAGVLPLVTLTGAQLIEDGVQPKSGEVILITGAAGSVGRTAVLVAKQHGAKAIGGVRNSQKTETSGADSVVALDDEADIATLPELDAIADTIDGETLGKLIPRVKKSGRVASVVGRPEAALKAGIEGREVWSQPDPERLHRLAEDFHNGRLKIPIVMRLPLSEIRQAHEAAEKGVSGKIALYP